MSPPRPADAVDAAGPPERTGTPAATAWNELIIPPLCCTRQTFAFHLRFVITSGCRTFRVPESPKAWRTAQEYKSEDEKSIVCPALVIYTASPQVCRSVSRVFLDSPLPSMPKSDPFPDPAFRRLHVSLLHIIHMTTVASQAIPRSGTSHRIRAMEAGHGLPALSLSGPLAPTTCHIHNNRSRFVLKQLFLLHKLNPEQFRTTKTSFGKPKP